MAWVYIETTVLKIRIRKNIVKNFKDTNFSIDIIINLVEVNLLGVTFNLANETYRPYKKPNDEIKYIIVSSNYPPQVIKEIANIINEKLSRNSSNKKVFNESKSYYEDPLNKSGYKTQNVSTNVAQTFLKLIDKHFPRSLRFYKTFNRNTMKLSCSCIYNIE